MWIGTGKEVYNIQVCKYLRNYLSEMDRLKDESYILEAKKDLESNNRGKQQFKSEWAK